MTKVFIRIEKTEWKITEGILVHGKEHTILKIRVELEENSYAVSKIFPG